MCGCLIKFPHSHPGFLPTSVTKWMLCTLKTDEEILFFSNTPKLETWTKVICCISSRPASITRRWQFPVPPNSWDWRKMATMGTCLLSPLRIIEIQILMRTFFQKYFTPRHAYLVLETQKLNPLYTQPNSHSLWVLDLVLSLEIKV